MRMLLRMLMVVYRIFSIQSTPLAFVLKCGDLFEKKIEMIIEKNGFTLHNHETILCCWGCGVVGFVGFVGR